MALPMDRIQAAQARMQEHGIDALLLLNAGEYRYFIGEERMQQRAIIPAHGEPVVFVFREEIEEASAALAPAIVRPYGGMGDMMRAINETVRELGLQAGRIGVEQSLATSLLSVQRFQQGNPGVQIVDSQPAVAPLRMIKSADELALMRRAGGIAIVGMEAALRALREGITENEIAAEAEYAMRRAGAEGVALRSLVNSGPRSARLHGGVTGRQLAHGELISIALSPKYEGYCASLTRTVLLGTPTPQQQGLFDVYLAMQNAVIDAARPGTRVSDLNRVALRIATAAGFARHFVPGFSHGIGLALMETPSTTDSPRDASLALQVGMTVTAGHSLLAVEAIGGVRLEDTGVIGEEGWQTLTPFPRSLDIR